MNIKILFFCPATNFAKEFKLYLELYDFQVELVTKLTDLFAAIKNHDDFDILISSISGIEHDYTDIIKFHHKLKILFISHIIPKLDILKEIEKYNTHFLIQYSSPFKWKQKIVAIVNSVKED
ncbi:MAG: hypothetical protein GY830_08645 [Bacteroidetes bacterium]|nr:hypothetical protein [Bacteroidota bacterium]